MGVSYAKSEVTSLTKVLTEVTMQTIQECVTQVSQSQYVNAANTGFSFWGTTNVQQSTMIKSTCFSNVQKEQELQNNLIQAIKNYNTSEGLGVLGILSASVADAKTLVETSVKNTVKMSNIQQTYNSIIMSQGVNFSNSGVALFPTNTVIQGSQVFADATMQELSKSGIFNKIESSIDQTNSAKITNPLDALANILGSFGMAVFAVIGGIILLFVILMGMGMIGGGSSGSSGSSGGKLKFK